MNVEELVDHLRCGKRLKRPQEATDHIYYCMNQCWKESVSERITLKDLEKMILNPPLLPVTTSVTPASDYVNTASPYTEPTSVVPSSLNLETTTTQNEPTIQDDSNGWEHELSDPEISIPEEGQVVATAVLVGSSAAASKAVISGGLRGAKAIGQTVGTALAVVDVALSSVEIMKQKEKLENNEITKQEFAKKTGEISGAVTGRLVGSTSAATVGSVVGSMLIPVPVLGTFVGGAVGAVLGSWWGGKTGKAVGGQIGESIGKNFEEENENEN